MKKILFLCTFCILMHSVQAQSLRRSTLSSIGAIKQVGDTRISSSLGQLCVGCDVLESPDGTGFLRQGFQQPNPNLTPCGFASSIAVEPLETECGTYYNFEYLGSPTSTDVQFDWNFGPNASPSTSTEQNPSNVAFSQIGGQQISVTITVIDVCSESVSANLNVTDTAFGTLVSQSNIDCFGNSNGMITVDYFGGTEPYSIVWSDDPNAGRIRENLPVGDYPFTIRDAEGCEYTSTVTIEAPTSPVTINTVSLVPESCTDTQDGSIDVDIIGGSEGYEILWSTGASGLRIDDLSSGEYSITVTDLSGCVATQEFTVFNICDDGESALYDVISPNADGVNDTWTIPGIANFQDNVVEIHNRWGDLVWNTTNYINGDATQSFNGNNNSGQALPTGAYFYVIQYNNEEKTILSGSITVIR